MAYRDVTESLRAYRDRIRADLDEARRAREQAEQIGEKVKVLEAELAETEQLLAHQAGGGRRERRLPLLDDVAIAAPCNARWEEMVGDEHVRFCGQCAKNVYNLSSLSRDEAEALLAARSAEMCVRLYRRADGTVLTEDCPVGVKRRRRRRAVAGVVGGGLLAAGAALAASATTATVRQGGIAPPGVADVGAARTKPEPGEMGQVTPVATAMGSITPIAPPPTSTAPAPHVVLGRRVVTR